MPTPPFHVFYSYSHADVRMLERLRKHLALLRRHGLITEWYDRDIEAGAQWRAEIERELDAADVILLLVSADFLASDFCYEQEMQRALARAERGEATLIGVMLRPVDGWEGTPFARFQLVPRDARPITTWSNADAAYSDVAARIRAALEERVRAASADPGAHGTEMPRAADLAGDPSAAARAGEIAAALAELLALGDAAEFVVVNGDADANYYTQSFAEEGSFWCEAVSSLYLDAAHALAPEQEARLAAFGWNPPAESLPNWWCVQAEPADAAALMVRTLADVYGVRLAAPLSIDRSWLG